MVAPEAHANPLRTEGAPDVSARPPSSMLRVPFPVASNVVPPHCGPGPYVSTRRLLDTRHISHRTTSSLTDWFFFLVLDIGNDAVEAIPLNLRVVLGLIQATAVRAAGFAAVPLAALAPGVR